MRIVDLDIVSCSSPSAIETIDQYLSRTSTRASVGSALVESVLGMRQTVAFGQEEREAARFRTENDRFITRLLDARRTTSGADGG